MSIGPSPARLRPDPLAAARGRAHLRDCLGYLGIAAALVPPGIVLRRAVQDPRRLRCAVTVASTIPPVVATLLAARAESGPHRATWGKRAEHLQVVDDRGDGAALPLPRALLRSAAKVGVPWQLGHMVALGAAWGDLEARRPAAIAATALIYPMLGAMVAAVVLPPGRALHDRIAGSRVERG